MTWGIPAVGAFVNVRVAPLTLHTVSPAASVEFNCMLSRNTLMLSVLAFKDERVNTLVDESGVICACINLHSS